jgi:hypothetical protein
MKILFIILIILIIKSFCYKIQINVTELTSLDLENIPQ